MRKIFTFFVLLALVGGVMAQSGKQLAHFSGIQTGKIVLLTFVIRAGSTCDGVHILRSVNRKDFYEIGQLTGVCGNERSDETFSFTDISPVKNTENFYKLDLTGLGTSDIISVQFIDFGNKDFKIIPEIIKDKSTLYFQNDCNDEFEFILLDKKGKRVRKVGGLRGNSVEVAKGDLKAGVYTFQILIEGEVKWKGSITVL